MGMAVGPEALYQRNTAHEGALQQREAAATLTLWTQFPARQAAFRSPSSPSSDSALVPTQLLRPVATQTSSVGPTGQLEDIRVATHGSGLSYDACKVVPALKPGVRDRRNVLIR
jgi:hypothetical protein